MFQVLSPFIFSLYTVIFFLRNFIHTHDISYYLHALNPPIISISSAKFSWAAVPHTAPIQSPLWVWQKCPRANMSKSKLVIFLLKLNSLPGVPITKRKHSPGNTAGNLETTVDTFLSLISSYLFGSFPFTSKSFHLHYHPSPITHTTQLSSPTLSKHPPYIPFWPSLIYSPHYS